MTIAGTFSYSVSLQLYSVVNNRYGFKNHTLTKNYCLILKPNCLLKIFNIYFLSIYLCLKINKNHMETEKITRKAYGKGFSITVVINYLQLKMSGYI